jgi:hypothetical protein
MHVGGAFPSLHFVRWTVALLAVSVGASASAAPP